MADAIRFKGNRITGEVGKTLSAEYFLRLGRSAGLVIRKHEQESLVLIGKDPRLSGYPYEQGLVSGLAEVGVHVKTTGPLPVQGVAALTVSLRADLGFMLSGGELPYTHNGLHLFGSDGKAASLDLVKKIETEMDTPVLAAEWLHPHETGHVERIESTGRYVELLKGLLPRGFQFQNFRVVLDCAHGATYSVGPTVFRELGAESNFEGGTNLLELASRPDGRNINDSCGTTNPLFIRQKVREYRADAGVALNGDGSKVLIFDERGEPLSLRALRNAKRETTVDCLWARDGLASALRVLYAAQKRGCKLSELGN